MDAISTAGNVFLAIVVDFFRALPGFLTAIPGLVVMYVILVSGVGYAGRLLRRHGRLRGSGALAGTLSILVFAFFLVISVTSSNYVPQGWGLFFFFLACFGGS